MIDRPTINLYVASKSAHGPLWRGFRADWEPLGVAITSTWIDESEPGESASIPDLWRRCIAEAASADALIAFHSPDEQWKGAYVEIGAALAAGVPVWIVGHPPGSFTAHELITSADGIDSAIRHVIDTIGRTNPGDPKAHKEREVLGGRPTPHDVANTHGHRHSQRVARTMLLADLRAAGYVIVHPDDIQVQPVDRDRPVGPYWSDTHWAEGWNDCRAAVFGEGS